MAVYRSPTGHYDPSSDWVDEANAHDGNVATGSYSDIPASSSAGRLELNFPLTSIEEVTSRFSATFANFRIRGQTYWGYAWHTFFDNTYLDPGTVELITPLSPAEVAIKVGYLIDNLESSVIRVTIREVSISGVQAPTVTTQAVTLIEETTATGYGTITDTGGENNTKRGVCWDIYSNPTINDSKSEETGSFTIGAFTRPITGLNPGTLYAVRAYSYNPTMGYSYGANVTFTTKPNAPTSLAAAVISSSQLDLTWAKGSGATKTMVRRKVGSYPTSVTDGDQAYYDTGTSFSDTGLIASTSYYYRAWSWVSGGPNSGYSDTYSEANATTFSVFVKAYTLDALIAAPTTKTYALDAIIWATVTKTLTLDAILWATVTKTLTLDALIAVPTTKTYTLDVLIAVPTTKTYTLDTILWAPVTKTYTLDVILYINIIKSYSLDAKLKSAEMRKLEGVETVVNELTVVIDNILLKPERHITF